MHDTETTTDRTTLQQKFAKFVKDKRTSLGWSQSLLADKVFGNPSYKNYISKIESGTKKSMNIETVDRFMVAFNSDIEFIE